MECFLVKALLTMLDIGVEDYIIQKAVHRVRAILTAYVRGTSGFCIADAICLSVSVLGGLDYLTAVPARPLRLFVGSPFRAGKWIGITFEPSYGL